MPSPDWVSAGPDPVAWHPAVRMNHRRESFSLLPCVLGSMKDGSDTFRLDVTQVKGKGCLAKMSTGGKGSGSFQLRVIGRNVWLKADRAFYKSNAGGDPAVLNYLTKKWIKIAKNSSLSSMTDVCSIATLMTQDGEVPGEMTKGATTTIGGQPVLELIEEPSVKLFVSIIASPKVVRISSPEDGDITFSAYNVPVKTDTAAQFAGPRRPEVRFVTACGERRNPDVKTRSSARSRGLLLRRR